MPFPFLLSPAVVSNEVRIAVGISPNVPFGPDVLRDFVGARLLATPPWRRLLTGLIIEAAMRHSCVRCD
jgi:hypothetical protein